MTRAVLDITTETATERRTPERHPERVVHRRGRIDRILLRMGHEPGLRQLDLTADVALPLGSHPGAPGAAGPRTRDALPLPGRRGQLLRHQQRRGHDVHHPPRRDRAGDEAGHVRRPGQHHVERRISGRQPRHEVLLRIRVDDRIRKRNARRRCRRHQRRHPARRSKSTSSTASSPITTGSSPINSFGKSIGQDLSVQRAGPAQTGDRKHRSRSRSRRRPRTSRPTSTPTTGRRSTSSSGGKRTASGQRPRSASRSAVSDNEPIPVDQEITGLTPGTIYFLRAVAANIAGTTEGEEISFITPDVPRVDSTLSESVTQDLGASRRAGRGAWQARRMSASSTGRRPPMARARPEVPIGEEPDLAQSRRRRQQPDGRNHLPLPDRRDQRDRDHLWARSDVHDRGGTAQPEVDGGLRQVEPPGKEAGRKGETAPRPGEECQRQAGKVPAQPGQERLEAGQEAEQGSERM